MQYIVNISLCARDLCVCIGVITRAGAAPNCATVTAEQRHTSPPMAQSLCPHHETALPGPRLRDDADLLFSLVSTTGPLAQLTRPFPPSLQCLVVHALQVAGPRARHCTPSTHYTRCTVHKKDPPHTVHFCTTHMHCIHLLLCALNCVAIYSCTSKTFQGQKWSSSGCPGPKPFLLLAACCRKKGFAPDQKWGCKP